MPFQHKRLVGPLALTTSSTLVYTVPASKTSIVKQVVVTNTTGSSATFTLRIGATTALFNGVTVAANDSLLINLSQVLATAETLYASASANSTLNLTISGVENEGPIEPTETYIADGAITAAKLSTSAGAVMVFADSSARSTAIPSPIEGMVSYLQSTNSIEGYDGSAWVGLTTSSLIVGPTSNSQGMGIRPYAIAGISGAAYGVYMGSQTYASNYGNGYVLWSNGSQTYVRGNNITMYAGTEIDDTSWVQMETNRVRIAANYNVGFDMDSSGRINMPYQPVFQAYGPVASAASGTFPVRFTNTYINQGSVYNTSTGYFTAPVTGKYFISWSFLAGPNNDVYRFYLRKNGANIGTLHLRADTSATGTEYATNSNATWIISLVAGDTLGIYFIADGGNAFYNAGGSEYSNFGGYLIG